MNMIGASRRRHPLALGIGCDPDSWRACAAALLARTGLMALGCLLNFPAVAANGDLDGGFGSGGVAYTGLNTAFANEATSPVIQPDGKILICSQLDSVSGYVILVARFTANGTLDIGFGSGGLTTISFNNSGDVCAGLALQQDGKIVVAGTTFSSSQDFVVARLNSDGTLDTAGFGNGTGKKTIAFDAGSPYNDFAEAVTLQKTDGKIVVAGSADTGSGGLDFAVARLNTDGSRDTSLNYSGMVTVGFDLPDSTSKQDQAFGVAIDADGNIVLGGSANKGSPGLAFAVARLSSTGVPDSSFGTNSNGRVTIEFDSGGNSSDSAQALLLQGDGKIVLAGYTESGANPDMAIARLLPNGSPDSGFGINGKAVVAFDLTADYVQDYAYDVVEQSNGKLLLVGNAQTGSGTRDAAAARLNADGSPDDEFGTSGKIHIGLARGTTSDQEFRGVAFQGSQIIASGVRYYSNTSEDNFVVRLQNDLVFANGFGYLP